MAFFLDNNKADQLLLGQGSNTALSERKARPTSKKKRRGKNPGGQLTAQDLVSLFQSMPVPNRGFKNPNADKPSKMGQGMAWFDANNSPDQVAERQNRVDQNRQSFLDKSANQGAAVVDFMKQTKGYTDAQGNFVSPTIPSEISSPYGTGSVVFTDKPTRGTTIDPLTGKTVSMSNYLPQQSLVQDSKYGAMPGQGGGGALTKPKTTKAPAPASNFGDLFEPRLASISQATTFAKPDWIDAALKPSVPTSTPAAAPVSAPLSEEASALPPGFTANIQAQYQSPPVRQSNPFVGAPYGGKLNARQEEILNLFAPIKDNRVVSGNTNEFHSVFPGTIGQLYWPMMQNADVGSFKQFFPEMDWTADYTDKSRQQIQDNFNALIKQNAIRVGPNGRYQLVPQIPMERLVRGL